jgi:hypothetical protein
VTPAKLLKSNLTLGQLLVDEPQLIMLQQNLKAKLALNNILYALGVKSRT